MLEIIRDEDNNIKAVCEYYIVDANGNLDDKGLFCWINECEVSKGYRNNGCLKGFISTIIMKYPQLQFGYFWRREKYPDRPPRIYTKKQWLKRLA